MVQGLGSSGSRGSLSIGYYPRNGASHGKQNGQQTETWDVASGASQLLARLPKKKQVPLHKIIVIWLLHWGSLF